MEQDREAIIRDLHYGLPNQMYLRFVAQHLLYLKRERPVDPFDPQIPSASDKLGATYVPRSVRCAAAEAESGEKAEDVTVRDEVSQPGTAIIVGPEGRGKSTLFLLLPTWLGEEKRSLIVPMPLDRVQVSVPEQALMEGQVSLLEPKLIGSYIFNAYWDGLLRDDRGRYKHLEHLRRSRSWMERLRWFYQHYPPIRPDIPEEFELMAWLEEPVSGGPFSAGTGPDRILGELVRFVTFATSPEESLQGVAHQPYTGVQVLVDSTEQLSNLAITRLVCDAQTLHNLGVTFKLFMTSAWQDLVEGLRCVRTGQVRVYHLPPWSETQLRQLLSRRVETWREGESTGQGEELNWSPTTGLKPAARPRFVDIIVKSAHKVSTNGKDPHLDAPVHALRLARSLVAACAGCWKAQGWIPPLGVGHLQELVDLYLKRRKTEQEAQHGNVSKS